jgi:hypothetical protein
MNSRRYFIKLSGLALIGGLAANSSLKVFGQTSRGRDYFLIPDEAYAARIFSPADFEPYLESVFRVSDKQEGIENSLRLVEIVENDSQAIAPGARYVNRFSLIFEKQGKADLADKIYRFSHPSMGDFEIFISTVGRSGKRYQAVFSYVYL